MQGKVVIKSDWCSAGGDARTKGHVFDIKKGPIVLPKPPKGPGSQCVGSLTAFVPLHSDHDAYMICKCGISEPYFRWHQTLEAATQIMSHLTADEKKVNELTFGLNGKEKLGPSGIADKLKMSASKVSKLRYSIYNKLKVDLDATGASLLKG